MKKIYSLLLMLCSALIISSCTDSIDECAPGELVSGQGVFFPTSTVNSYEVEGSSGSITVKVGRTIASEASEVEVNTVISEGGESLFEIPTKVSFEQDKLESELTINYNNLVRGTTYTVTISFPGNETKYSQTSLDFTIIWPNEVVYEWEVISDKAVLVDNMFNMLMDDSGNSMGNYALTDITVEKVKGKNIIRFKSPYDNEYFKKYITGEDNFFGSDFVAPYIVLDGEKYKVEGQTKPMWYIEPSKLGFAMTLSGDNVSFGPDSEWVTFGSIAGNLQTSAGPIEPGSEDFPLGTYDEKSLCYDLGAVFQQIKDYGYWTYNSASFKLYLDPSYMSPDYNRDYTWVDVEDSEGEYISELAGQSMVKVLQQAEEDETFYRIPDLYAQGYPLYFNLDKEAGTVSIPKEIPIETGMTVLGGNKVYVKGVSGKSSYNAENGVISLGLSFYLADEDGNEITELATSNDKFVWGKSGMDLFVPVSSIDEYVGNWMTTIHDSEGAYNAIASITKTDGVVNSLTVSGLVGRNDYDDSFTLQFAENTSLLEFSPQQVQDFSSYNIFVGVADDNYFYPSDSEKLIGGISIIDGNLKFINVPTNQLQWKYLTYLAYENSEYQGYLIGNIELDWTRVEDAKTTASTRTVEPMIFKPSDIKKNDKKLNIKLYNSKIDNASKSGFKVNRVLLQNMSDFRLSK